MAVPAERFAELRQWVDANPTRINDWDRDEDGITPLYAAVRFIRSLPLVLWLLDEKGADMNARLDDGQTPRTLNILKVMLDRRADPTVLDDNDKSPLMCHAYHGRVDIVGHLLQDPRVRAAIDVQDNEGDTAFHFACLREDMDDTTATSIL